MATTRIDFEGMLTPGAKGPKLGLRAEAGGRYANSACRTDDEADIFNIARCYASDRRFVPAGAELFAEGETSDSLFVVLGGWLFLHRILEDGRRQILDFALPGAVLGYHTQPRAPFTFSAEAITDADVAVIPLARITDLLGRSGSCALILLDAANQSLFGVFDNLTDVGRRTAREAVAHFLLRMSRRIRALAGSSTEDAVSFPLRQDHIGDALGLTSVHVCRTLGKLRKDGLVEIGHGRLRILDADALAEDAGVSYFYEDEAAAFPHGH